MPDTEALDAVMSEVASTREAVGRMHHEALVSFAGGSNPPTGATEGSGSGPMVTAADADAGGVAAGDAPTPVVAAASAATEAATALAPSGKIVASVPDRLSKPVRKVLCWFLGGVAVFALLVGAVVASLNSSQAVPLFLTGGVVSIGALAFMYLIAMGFGKVDLQASLSGGAPSSGEPPEPVESKAIESNEIDEGVGGVVAAPRPKA